MPRSSPHGSALLVVLVVLAVLSLAAVASISFTGRERESAAVATRGEEVRACAEVARANVLGRLRSIGVRPTEIQFADKLLDAELGGESQFRTGHVTTDAGVTVAAVQLVQGAGGSRQGARDVTNLIGPSVLGGQFYRIAVTCQGRGLQHEIEFLVRFGI
jgi:hypothetical protein